jgi:hypothetical protein
MALGKLSAESWTVLVYMAADNNLAQAGLTDLNSMETAVQPEGLNLIVQADFPGGAKRYRIQQDNSPAVTSPVLSNLGVVDSGDYHTLNSFINWGFGAYPSDRKMLVIWSHGNSWYKGSDPKWICPDDGSGNTINVYNGQLASAFANAPHLDILLFDACSMQSIEVLSEVHQVADYVIGSADLVPVNGFPYETIIPLFSSDVTNIVTQIPLLYVDSYLPWGEINTGGQYWTTTCSSIMTANLPQFVTAFKHFAIMYRSAGADLLGIRQQCFSMNDGMADVDMMEFLLRVANAGLGNVSAAATELKSMWEAMVKSNAHTTPQMIPNIGTGALWFPDFRLNFTRGWERYSHLQFADTQWLRLVNHALGDDIPPPAPILLSKSVEKKTLRLLVQSPSDPDSLYYELQVTEGNSTYTYYYSPNATAQTFSVTAPITRFGSYKLFAIDPNGNRSAALEGDYSFSSVTVSPNPIRNKNLATLHWLAGEDVSGALLLEIFNLRGQKVLSRELGTVSFGSGSYPLFADAEFKNFPAGRYFIRLNMGTKQFAQKLIILY